jgi:hypothetical protein
MSGSATFVRPVELPQGAFAFCRWSLALALWAALLAHQAWLVAATGAILAASALLGVGRSPMIMLWRWTAHRLLPTAHVVLDANAMRFAHAMGALLCAVTFTLLLTMPLAGRAALLLLVALKTVGALGFCTASKLYECTARGGCCGILGRRDA